MCIIWNDSPSMAKLTRAWIKDFHVFNADGLGAMYLEDGQLKVERTVGTLGEQIDLYNRIRDKGLDVMFHIRKQTHGDKSLEMCHPYEVFGETNPHPTIDGYQMYLMHNGILSTGNKKDPTKSDTWWFIEDYLRTLIQGDSIGFFTNTVLHELLGDFIGNNRFAIMDNLGNQIIINKEQGVDWDGRWMSNTYAWSAVDAGVIKPRKLGGLGGGYRGYSYNSGGVDAWWKRQSEFEVGGGVTTVGKGSTAPAMTSTNPQKRSDADQFGVETYAGADLVSLYELLEDEIHIYDEETDEWFLCERTLEDNVEAKIGALAWYLQEYDYNTVLDRLTYSFIKEVLGGRSAGWVIDVIVGIEESRVSEMELASLLGMKSKILM